MRVTQGDGDLIVVVGVTTHQGGWDINQPQGEGGQELSFNEYKRYAKCKQPNIFYKLYVRWENKEVH
jgi:hypothetical protein